MNARVGGHGGWWVVLGTYGVYADMCLIWAGVALAGGGLVFSIIGLIGNVVRRRGALAIVAAIALAVSVLSLACGAACYDKYLPMYEKFREAMELRGQHDATVPNAPAASQ